ncbi:glycosyl hydrolase family 95 catalytic domain-containing protein [Streptomyces tanashiensis]|uniref:glycosyl hydrolase family 95 catalytic domain-containing protein n=1 Tax=Streptomyces tanashiensis TaxID=67367 RepID=UPI003F4CC27C
MDSCTDIHHHTSHLFAVHPGRQITTKSPAFSAAALVSLKARCGEKEGIPFTAATVSGDRRRSWTWPWRATLFARLGDGQRAQTMLRGLPADNTLHNLLSNHPPFQMDGNLGISGAVAEMLLQSHDDASYEVSCTWRDGKVTSSRIVADRARNRGNVPVRVDGVDTNVKPIKPRRRCLSVAARCACSVTSFVEVRHAPLEATAGTQAPRRTVTHGLTHPSERGAVRPSPEG